MNVGDVVPDFSLPDEAGSAVSLNSLLEKGPVVIFFYPVANSAGCTAESCHFRDLKSEFDGYGAQVVGISGDKISKQATFTARNSFNFPLLSDSKAHAAAIFGTKRVFSFVPFKRHTFVISQDHRVVAVIKSETKMGAHADLALKALAGLAGRSGQVQ